MRASRLIGPVAFALAAAFVPAAALSPAAAQPALVARYSTAQYKSFGSTGAPDRALPPPHRCRDYHYHYVVRPRTADWLLEIRLLDPRGRGLLSDIQISGADPKKGQGTSRICTSNTVAGTFVMRSKLTLRHGNDQQTGYVRRGTFRLHR